MCPVQLVTRLIRGCHVSLQPAEGKQEYRLFSKCEQEQQPSRAIYWYIFRHDALSVVAGRAHICQQGIALLQGNLLWVGLRSLAVKCTRAGRPERMAAMTLRRQRDTTALRT